MLGDLALSLLIVSKLPVRQLMVMREGSAAASFSKLPVRQLMVLPGPAQACSVSKLPVRQLIKSPAQTCMRKFSKLPVRQLMMASSNMGSSLLSKDMVENNFPELVYSPMPFDG